MLLTSYDPFTREFDRLAQRVFGTTNGGALSRRSVIPMDSIRRQDEVELRFDLPGIDPESIEVTVDRGVLTVGASRTEEYAEGERPYRRRTRVRLADVGDGEQLGHWAGTSTRWPAAMPAPDT